MADDIIIKEEKGKMLGTVDKENQSVHLMPQNIYVLLNCQLCVTIVFTGRLIQGQWKMSKYEADASCAIREDIQKVIGDMDTRDPEQLKGILDYLVKLYTEQIFVALGESKMDGNIQTGTPTHS